MTAQCAGECNLITTGYNELILCLTTHVPIVFSCVATFAARRIVKVSCNELETSLCILALAVPLTLSAARRPPPTRHLGIAIPPRR